MIKMIMNIRIFGMVCILLFCCFVVRGQAGAPKVCLDSVRVRLERAARLDSTYFSEIDLSIGHLSIGELLRNIARVHGVNLCVKVDEGRMVTCNFNRARLIDLLYFLCREYNLELDVVGNIISLSEPVPLVVAPREPKIETDSTKKRLYYDLLDDGLVAVMKRVTALTGEHVVIPKSLYGNRVSGYSAGLPVLEAIRTLASVNGLEIERDKNGVWRFEAPLPPAGGNPALASSYVKRRNFTPDQVNVDSTGRVSVSLNRGNIHDVVLEIFERLGMSRLFLTSLDQQTSLFVKDVDVPTLLNVLFAGTPFTYQVEGGIYIFGSTTKDKTLVTTRVVPLRYRTVDKVVELIPTALKPAGTQVQMFAEQNSIIVSGTSRQVELVERFLESIDQSVPLVTIEVLIVDSKKSVIHEVGIEAGIGKDGPATTAGTLSPGVNMSLSATSINRLINSFNGFGSINLGKVTPDFYMSLQALEATGNIELRSTPKLSTLNGHSATLKSGETKYYKEVQTNYYGSQTPVPSESYTWKPVEANLKLDITPFVSRDGKITLQVKIEQSQFTEREGKIDEEAPPGAVTRSFESQVQVRDGEMVLLGGIDNNTREKSSSGIPFIARIPVLKWLFGKTKNNKVDQKLNVFIKPSVIY